MKRSICLLLAVLICLVLPVTAYAETYQLSDTDLSIQMDDSIWYVFTRDNIKNNPELEELEIDYDQIHSVLYDNNAYMDAALYYEDGDYIEFFIRKTTNNKIANLSNYKDKVVMELAAELAKKQGAEIYSVYENEYKFARLEYVDTALGYHVCEFYTVVNKENYTFTFQSTFEFGDFEYEKIEEVMDGIRFDVDPSLKEPNSSAGKTIIGGAIGGALIGGAVGGFVALNNKKKSKAKADAEAASANGPELN